MAYFYPHTYNHVKKFAESLNAEMGWIGIVRLEPRSSVGLHFDQGYYYLIRDRYHLVLQSKGSIMHCEDKTSIWHAGEHWWFNNKKVHSATNDSDDWRIHVIFDLLPKKCSQFVGRVSGLQAYNPW
jgi:aspartyl/asparaginyl beta-hydroxylase (cupin superfamily)